MFQTKMAAIVCNDVKDVDHIVLSYRKCTEYGLSPTLLVSDRIHQALGQLLFSAFGSANPVDALIVPAQNIAQCFPQIFNVKHIIVTFESIDIQVPHPFNHLKVEKNRCILAIATNTGFPQVKTFNGLFTNDLVREMLSIPSPTFITEWNRKGFVFKGGVGQPNALAIKRIPAKVEGISGIKSTIKIMPCTNWTTSEHLVQEWSRFCVGSNIELTTQTPDYFLVINSTNQPIDPNKTIYFMMEPYGEKLYANWIGQYKKLMFLGSHLHHLNNVEWHLNYSTKDLQEMKMTPDNRINGLCAIVSSRCADPGQRYRLELVKRLDQMELPFSFHIYGQCKELNFKNYKGELPRISKEQALVKYKYNLICENNDIDNYITEKLYDGIMTETYTFYKGAPNVKYYFNPDSFGGLTGSLEQDLQIIQDSITNGVYEYKLPFIREMKKKILTQWVLPARLNSILELVDCIVLVRYPNQQVLEQHSSEVDQMLFSQSLMNVGKGVFEQSGDIHLANISNHGLQQTRCVLAVEYNRVTNMLFQTISNLLHLTEIDLFRTEDESIQYVRLKGCEKIMMNQVNNQALTTGISKCVFKE